MFEILRLVVRAVWVHQSEIIQNSTYLYLKPLIAQYHNEHIKYLYLKKTLNKYLLLLLKLGGLRLK